MSFQSDDYYLQVANSSGVVQAVVTDFDALTASKRVNRPGLLRFILDESNSNGLLDSLEKRSLFTLFRRDTKNGLGWYEWRPYLFVKQRWIYPEKKTVELTGVDPLWLLNTRVVAWKAKTNLRSQFTADPAETIMKTLVDYNLGANATAANGRLRDGAITGVTVETDAAGGTSIDLNCFGQNVLEAIQKIAAVCGCDFDMVRTSAVNFEFRFYAGQLGTDRSATLAFSMPLGNMGEPDYMDDGIEEKTVAIVGGQGEGDDREFAIRFGPDFLTTNDVEGFHNASGQESTTAGYNAAGDRWLEEHKATKKLDFDILQTESSVYDVHYGLGDKVSSVNPFTGDTVTKKIEEIIIRLDEIEGEVIDLSLVEV